MVNLNPALDGVHVEDLERLSNIDHLLFVAKAEWQELPEIAAEIATWNSEEELVFVLEWPLAEMRLESLAQAAEQGQMTPDQEQRYQALLTLVAKYRPIIERLRSL